MALQMQIQSIKRLEVDVSFFQKLHKSFPKPEFRLAEGPARFRANNALSVLPSHEQCRGTPGVLHGLH